MIEEKIRQKGIYRIANELGVKPQRVSNWISRKSYPKEFLIPLAQVLDMSLEELLKEMLKGKK